VAAFIMNRPEEERQLAPALIEGGRRVSPATLMEKDQIGLS